MPDDERDILFEDEWLQRGFSQIPNVVIRSRTLSMGAKVAYAVLCSYAWQDKSCFPGQARMAVDMGCTEQSVRTYLRELEAAEIIKVRRRGQGRTNLYMLPRLIGDPREP